MVNPEDPDWEIMASGKKYSYKYGFGALDAYEYVKAAKTWKSVKPQAWIDLPAVQIDNGTMNAQNEMTGGLPIIDGGIKSKIQVTQSALSLENFEALEHVTVKVWITHGRRGEVEVELISPNGIKSVLAARRQQDDATSGYPGWQFMTVKHW